MASTHLQVECTSKYPSPILMRKWVKIKCTGTMHWSGTRTTGRFNRGVMCVVMMFIGNNMLHLSVEVHISSKKCWLFAIRPWRDSEQSEQYW